MWTNAAGTPMQTSQETAADCQRLVLGVLSNRARLAGRHETGPRPAVAGRGAELYAGRCKTICPSGLSERVRPRAVSADAHPSSLRQGVAEFHRAHLVAVIGTMRPP